MFKCIIYHFMERNLLNSSHIAVYDPYRISQFSHFGFIVLRGIFKLQINCIFINACRFCQEGGQVFVFPEVSYSHYGIYIGKLTL